MMKPHIVMSRKPPRRDALRASAAAIAFLSALCANSSAEARPPYRVEAVSAAESDYTIDYPLTGFIAAHVQSYVGFRTSGRIAIRRVDVGDHVKAGDILAELDPKDLQTAVFSAQAVLESARGQLPAAQAAFSRQQALMSSGFTTRSLFDKAEEGLRTAEAAVASAEAALGVAKEQLSFTTLKAGMDGIIVGRSAEVGQVVSPGQTVFTIAQDGPRDAEFDIQEAALTHPPKAGKVTIALLADPDVKTTGTVSEISPIADAGSGAVRVKVALDSNPPQMTLGASIIGSAPVESLRAFRLPESVLYEWEGKPAVWVVDPKSRRVSIRQVRVRAYLTNFVVLSSGIEPGDLVVSAGLQSLRPGEEVEVVGGAK